MITPLQGRLKRTLRSICMDVGTWDVQKLAQASGVTPMIVLAVLVGYSTDQHTANMLIAAINELKGTHYTLEDIQYEKGGKA